MNKVNLKNSSVSIKNYLVDHFCINKISNPSDFFKIIDVYTNVCNNELDKLLVNLYEPSNVTDRKQMLHEKLNLILSEQNKLSERLNEVPSKDTSILKNIRKRLELNEQAITLILSNINSHDTRELDKKDINDLNQSLSNFSSVNFDDLLLDKEDIKNVESLMRQSNGTKHSNINAKFICKIFNEKIRLIKKVFNDSHILILDYDSGKIDYDKMLSNIVYNDFCNRFIDKCFETANAVDSFIMDEEGLNVLSSFYNHINKLFNNIRNFISGNVDYTSFKINYDYDDIYLDYLRQKLKAKLFNISSKEAGYYRFLYNKYNEFLQLRDSVIYNNSTNVLKYNSAKERNLYQIILKLNENN